MEIEMSNLSKEDFMYFARRVGFTEEFSPLESQIISEDNLQNRKFFYLSGGYTGMESRMIRGGGPIRVLNLVENKPVKDYWQEEYPNEVTFIREDDDGKLEFADYFEDIYPSSKWPKITCGFIHEEPAYEGKIQDIKYKVLAAGGLLPLSAGESVSRNDHFTMEDKITLLLRDYRWENTGANIDHGPFFKAFSFIVSLGLLYLVDRSAKKDNEKRVKKLEETYGTRFNQKAIDHLA